VALYDAGGGSAAVPGACPRAPDFANLGDASEGSSGAELFENPVKSAVLAGSIPGASTTFTAKTALFRSLGNSPGDSGSCTTPAGSGGKTSSYKTNTIRIAAYLVVRVPQERWPAMPSALRPAPASANLPAEPKVERAFPD
jgi:hypothetical protein